ncbi:uncharacterized protein C6orf222-like [Rhinatrema bivittatum]|uniref:uncharacterized protein C6orf222-like n=1 Tax=Rhinatrema bivittatum TaxID=194408 RepID=UPI00112D5D1F|nr:uncharacterized protein C6orf222-like [Rhinatrema bivittatum]
MADRSNSLKMEGGKFLSLDRREAKKILEMYVRRSLSNCEGKARRPERTGKRIRKPRRVESDRGRYPGSRTAGEATPGAPGPREEEKPAGEKEAGPEEEERERGPADAGLRKGRKQVSWIKAIFSFFSKKKEDGSREARRALESEASPGEPGQGKGPRRRGSSLRRVISLKKGGAATEEEAAGRPKRPNFLPLQQVYKPARAGKKDTDLYCNKVSEEIELIVQGKESVEDRNRKQSLDDLPAEEALQTEAVIRRIAALLQRKGDQWNQKIKDDPRLNSFFQDMSYTTFKQLADVYVDKEVKTSTGERTPEEVKFAFTVHLTAKVAGISNYPVSRIMGFGTQYLQDTFAQFYRKMGLDSDTDRLDRCSSPD